MNKPHFLRVVAETAYNVGYAAKLNFASLDIIEKSPGFLGFISLVVGILALYLDEFATKNIGALMVIVGLICLYIEPYQDKKNVYESAGNKLTSQFYELKSIYFSARSRLDTDDFSDLISKHEVIEQSFIGGSVTKQVLLSEVWAHKKFFWEQQIDWIDEQKKFSFWRDKVPLNVLCVVAICLVWIIVNLLNKVPFISCLSIFK